MTDFSDVQVIGGRICRRSNSTEAQYAIVALVIRTVCQYERGTSTVAVAGVPARAKRRDRRLRCSWQRGYGIREAGKRIVTRRRWK